MAENSDEVLHRISFGFQDSGLTGQGLGPDGTSFPEQDYTRVTTWRGRLGRVVAPEFPHGHVAPSYWYRRFADGQGALLRRTPEENSLDGRGSRAQALVGAQLNAPRALLAALGVWPDLHAWLEEPGTTPPGWATVGPFVPSRVGEAAVRRLNLDAASQPGLVNLVAEVLRVPTGPVDLLAPDFGPLPEERERLLLLWGLYQALLDVVGTEESPQYEGVGWSFATHEPWPVRRGTPSERPRIAFRTAPPRAQAEPPVLLDVLAPEQDTVYHEVARWLVTLLGAGDGSLGELGRELRSLDAADHGEVIEYLARRARPAARTRVPAPSAPLGAGPGAARAWTVGSGRAAAEEDVPGTAGDGGSGIRAEDSEAAPAAADTARTDDPLAHPLSGLDGEPERGAFGAAPPNAADRPGRTGTGTGERSREAARHRSPDQRPWSAPGQHPRPGLRAAPPDGYAVDAAVDARGVFPPPDVPSEAQVQDLLDALGREHDPHRIAAIATRLVRQYQPSFSQHLVVRGYPRRMELRTEVVLVFAAGLALLLVLLLAANLLR
ncbi:hypothetical protein [Nocardiopsis alborubida]|uniref:Uncharacterized protein n=1 Tax=Nocardiopsis alborubida TaxID=146802 RepID=A0A7X6MFL9_9ACTN|nr:hypothetical protein [Nocardiopsis alborubida]NKZ00056.1 hypothetical protein [Nocardiopsis alborubida]